MSLPTVARVGAQLPRWAKLPPGRVSSAGSEAVDLARSVGLHLTPWQAWVLDQALAEGVDGSWSAFEVCLIVARQNGKNAILEALELAALFLFGERTIVHSAHKFDTAQEHFLRMRTLIEPHDDLMRHVARNGFVTANGKESIKLRSGARLKFVARSRGGARGFSGDRIVLDEAFDLPAKAMGAMLPTLRARPNTQVWYTSSPAHMDSATLHSLLRRVWADDPEDRLFGAVWGNEADVATDDLDAWYAANPSLGVSVPGWSGIAESSMWDEYRTLVGGGDPELIAEFRRELLGVSEIPDVSGVPGLPLDSWDACCDRRSTIGSGHRMALDVSPDKRWAAFAVAGFRADGLPHVEVMDRRSGCDWVVERAVDLGSRWGELVVDARSAAAAFIPQLRAAGVAVVEASTSDVSRACGALEAAVLGKGVRHIGQVPLSDAVAGASKREIGDGQFAWSRLDSRADICSLVAVTLAFGALPEVAPSRPVFAF